MAQIQNTNNGTNASEVVKQQELSFNTGGNVKWYIYFVTCQVVS
jgi:hypothetical protein